MRLDTIQQSNEKYFENNFWCKRCPLHVSILIFLEAKPKSIGITMLLEINTSSAHMTHHCFGFNYSLVHNTIVDLSQLSAI